MEDTSKYLQTLINQKKALVSNLVTQGVEASEDEKFNALIPKVLDIPKGITPTGTLEITENGEKDVTNYAKVNVNVNNEAEEQIENVIIQLATLVDVVVSTPTIPTVPTDLTGYTVTVPSGWSASAGLIEAIGINIKIGSIDYMNFSIGYEGFFSSDVFNFYRSSSSNFICVDVGYPPFKNYTPTESFTFQVVSGDVTNQTLIQWLVDNNAKFEKESA